MGITSRLDSGRGGQNAGWFDNLILICYKIASSAEKQTNEKTGTTG